jgi:restriction endonuclease Mrr
MAIPDFQTLMLPLVELASDGNEWSMQDARDHLARKFAVSEEEQTPEEMLDAAYQRLRRDTAADLVSRAKKSSAGFFEHLVVDLLLKMGYGGSLKEAGSAIGRSGDEGIDGIIKEDRLGLDVIYLQAKKWEGTVGRLRGTEIRERATRKASANGGFHYNRSIFLRCDRLQWEY